MSYSEIILRDSAEFVWPLDDLTESSSYSYAINFLSPTASAFGSFINTDNCIVGQIPMVFGGNTSLQLISPSVCFSIPTIGRFSDLYKDKNSIITFWLKVDSFSLDERPIMKKRGQDYCGLFIKETHLIFKFGKEEDHSIIVGELINPEEPHLISLVIAPDYRDMSIDARQCTTHIESNSFPDYDPNSDNEFLDFYGPSDGYWSIDCPAYYNNIIDDSTIKRQYVYGLGKWTPYDIFFNRGGSIYNFTTIATERNFATSWDFAEEWKLADYNNLTREGHGIKSISFKVPELVSFDNNILLNNNEINFSSSSATVLSYIDINNIEEKLYDQNSFFVKFKMPSTLEEEVAQRLITIGEVPDTEYLNINLELNSGSNQIIFTTPQTGDSATIVLTNTSYNEEFYVGFHFGTQSNFYVIESGSVVQTASFSYYNEEGYGQDPLQQYYPFKSSSRLRIGATNTYDLVTENLIAPFEFNQFRGSFIKFISMSDRYLDEINSINYLDSFIKSNYSFIYLSDEKRFRVSTYGEGEFYIHAIDIGEFISDLDQRLDANLVNIGYPDIQSSSAVEFYVTQETYSGSVVYPKTRLYNRNSLPFINNININGTRLKFEFSIYSEDRIYYPPSISYFKMETYGAGNSRVRMKDEGAPEFYIYPNSSSNIFLPETSWTPNVFLTDYSGLKSLENILEFSPDLPASPLNPISIGDMVLWLDARYPQGINRSLPNDDSRLNFWADLSGNENHATSDSIENSPIFRYQSLNLFTLNQMTGSDSGSLSSIASYNSSIQSSSRSIEGPRSIEIIPDGTSTNSYIEFSNTASISTFINQEYTVVGSIKYDKRQTASALNEYARKIVVLNDDGNGLEVIAESASIVNVAGTYSASLQFSTTASTLYSVVRFYNGSYLPDDKVYWDNLGLYVVSSSFVNASGGSASIDGVIDEWKPPLEYNDAPTIKFDGLSSYLQSSASVSDSFTLYIVSREFIDSPIISSPSSNFSISIGNDEYYINNQSSSVQINNLFNIYSIVSNSGSSRFIVNGIPQGNISNNSINEIYIGKNQSNYFSGDISAILLYSKSHDYQTRSAIENFLDESFNLIQNTIGLNITNDQYLDSYSERYPIS